MKLRKAIIKADQQKRGITRKSWGARPMWIIPTNTTVCMILMNGDKAWGTRWNPKQSDLLADDWIIYG